MPQRDDRTEWGVFARSFFWFAQSTVLGTIAVLTVSMENSGRTGVFVALGASFLTVYLLFRQIDALVDQKLAR